MFFPRIGVTSRSFDRYVRPVCMVEMTSLHETNKQKQKQKKETRKRKEKKKTEMMVCFGRYKIMSCYKSKKLHATTYDEARIVGEDGIVVPVKIFH